MAVLTRQFEALKVCLNSAAIHAVQDKLYSLQLLLKQWYQDPTGFANSL
jgi:glutathione synthase/RimK-type ligase-like ATP-grasp enzyme